MNHLIRPATEQEIHTVLEILLTGKKALAMAGVDQWQDNYPTFEMIADDVSKKESYLLFIDDQPVATFVFTEALDFAYDESGAFLLPPPYTSLHRVAVLPEMKGRGIGGLLVDYCKEQSCRINAVGLRCDTHADNKSMRRMMIKNGFIDRGSIRLADGSPRIAYELDLIQNINN